MFRLLIVDDEYYVRVGIKSAIDWSEIGVEVVGEAADGEEALEYARKEIIRTLIMLSEGQQSVKQQNEPPVQPDGNTRQ